MRLGFWERFKAWRRGERMIKGVSRGRCFEKKELDIPEPPTGGVRVCKLKPTISLIGITITRKDGTVEEHKPNG